MTNQDDLYTTIMLAVLAITLLWEMWRPLRKNTSELQSRWTLNFLLMGINMILIYFIVPVSLVSLALIAQQNSWGLFNQIQFSSVLVFVISLLIVDFAKYFQHYLLHKVGFLWKIHRVHHADPECDVTTSLRFHPFETILSVLIDSLVIVLFGVPALTVALYRIARVTESTLVHGNISFPEKVEKRVRYIFVTPDVHRIHHSVDVREHNGNYSGGLIWWDFIFGTYIAHPISDHRKMKLGLLNYPSHRSNSLRAMLLDPFLRS